MFIWLISLLLIPTLAFAQPVSPPLGIRDEGGAISRPVFILDCVGSGVSCSQSGITGTITASGGGSTITGENQGTQVASDVTTVNAATGLVATLNGTNQWDVYLSLPVSTATALNANGGNCSAGSYPLGVDTLGAVEDCTVLGGGGDALTANPLTQFQNTTSAQLQTVFSDYTGTGVAVFNNSPTITGLTVKTMLTADSITDSDLQASQFVATDGAKHLVTSGSSSALASSVNDETGTGQAVFNTSPSMTSITVATSFSFTSMMTGTTAGIVVNSSNLQIPTGTAPAMDLAGKIAQDTTDRGQLLFMSGLTVGIVTRTQEKCLTIENLAAADDNTELGSFPYPVTIEKVWTYCRGTCTTTAMITLEDAAANAMTLSGTAVAATTTNNAVAVDVTTGGALVAYEKFQFDVTNTPVPETDEYMICYEFSKTRQ